MAERNKTSGGSAEKPDGKAFTKSSEGLRKKGCVPEGFRGKAAAQGSERLKEKDGPQKSGAETAFEYAGWREELVREVQDDFKKRQAARRPLELQWRLNMNFVAGNQYAEITPRGDVEDFGKQYFWQEREVFNHIAPMVETRLSKLSRIRTGLSVCPATSDDRDVAAAKFSTAILNTVTEENNINELMREAASWSEVAGTAFFKVTWNTEKGVKLAAGGRSAYTGDAEISVCPPFEIYPENLNISELKNQRSVIHAKVYSADEVKRIWGTDIEGGSVNVFSMDAGMGGGGFGYRAASSIISSDIRDDSVIVIERYELPGARFEKGRLVTVAGDKLLYCGELPYINMHDGGRGYPFVKQVCVDGAGAFFGTSIVERTIPVQRAYNIVKNRKHELMNRLAMGILTVEDGSVDTDNLEEEGLSPGKILIYRQGSTPPRLLDPGSIPYDFASEEHKLLEEFVLVSGVSEIMKSSEIPRGVSSGRAISLLIEQDDSKVALTANSVRNALKECAQQILRLYKQFATVKRLKRISGENGNIELAAFSGSDISSDDVVFDTENELADSPSNRRNMALELLKMGVMNDENGKLPLRSRLKLLDILGFGNWESARDLDDLHLKKASRENQVMETESVDPDEIDHHELHVQEHVKAALSEKADGKREYRERLNRHITLHKSLAAGALAIAEVKKNPFSNEEI
ncbi:MAG: hypothetical protein LBC13_01610 [Clostridiales bacterium]|jgi:hypothetical protein|nr:hypothetical protein [Clostridiales bacterium]